MKFIKYSVIAILALSMASCLKPQSDFAGIRTDEGTIVTSITEQQYLNADGQNLGLGYTIFANFNFSTANEDVKFFSLHVSQPRDNKITGPLTVKITAEPSDDFVEVPAGAITIKDIVIPQSSDKTIDVPVKFTVNKALLDPALHYAVIFTISSVSQGVASANDKSVLVIINEAADYNESSITALYSWKSTVVDPLNQYGISNNTKPVNLYENAPGQLDIYDNLANSASLYVFNFTTGASTAIFAPRYILDANGNVTSVVNGSNTAAVTNLALDPTGENKFVYTSNDNRTLKVKYTFTLTTTIGGVATPRTVRVDESYNYSYTQAFY